MTHKRLKKGSNVETGYGQGVIIQSRSDGICVVNLGYGLLYTHPEIYPIRKTMTTQELNDAYEALETMRKLNLEVECSGLGIACCDHSQCRKCMLDSANQTLSSLTWSILSSIPTPLSSKKTEPCILCGSPTCNNHTSKAFAKEKVTLCVDCEALFQKEALHKSVPKEQLASHLEHLTDVYDRAFLLLRYSIQFLPPLLEQLNAEESNDNNMAFGTSSIGLMSGVMGFAGAAALFTPAGPPLLMASFVFGTGNAAVGLGYSAKKHLQAGPTQVANRLIALYGFCKAVMEAIVSFREQINADPDCVNVGSDNDAGQGTKKKRNAYLEGLSQGIRATKNTNTGLRVSNAAAYTTTSNVFQLLGAAPVIGQAFSAAMMVMDYQTATATWEKIKAGSQSDKAHLLQNMNQELMSFPLSSDLEIEVDDIMVAVQNS